MRVRYSSARQRTSARGLSMTSSDLPLKSYARSVRFARTATAAARPAAMRAGPVLRALAVVICHPLSGVEHGPFEIALAPSGVSFPW
jgi:hypothetical protein